MQMSTILWFYAEASLLVHSALPQPQHVCHCGKLPSSPRVTCDFPLHNKHQAPEDMGAFKSVGGCVTTELVLKYFCLAGPLAPAHFWFSLGWTGLAYPEWYAFNICEPDSDLKLLAAS